MKNKSQPTSDQDQSAISTPNFLDVESRVFTQLPDGRIFIGRDEVTAQLRSLLRDEAENLQTTRLWEILNASVINEAYHAALDQSKDFDAVMFAKALKHWNFFMMNVIAKLAKK